MKINGTYTRFPTTTVFLARFEDEMAAEKRYASGHPNPEHRASQLAADQAVITRLQAEAQRAQGAA